MKSFITLLTSSLTFVAAEDLLFPVFFQSFLDTSKEYSRATNLLNMSAKTVTLEEWSNMTTTDFAKFKGIVIADSNYPDISYLNFLNETKDIWGPAVTGNIILIGTDPNDHCCGFGNGAEDLIDNALKFAAAGTATDGAPQTGLYFAMAEYFSSAVNAVDGHVDALDYFGNFTMRGGDIGCYEAVHIVASSPALGNLNDTSLSNWGCSVHEAFTEYPSSGPAGFQALAIAANVNGTGTQEFGDGSYGLPYVISRGATPAKCGDGVWDENLVEECDDGNTVNGDGCSLGCKCEVGFVGNGRGGCDPVATTTTGGGYGPPPTETPGGGYC